MKILYMGTPELSAVILRRLLHESWPVVAVVSQPDRPKGRRGKISPTPVKEVALEHGIEVCQPESAKTEEFQSWVRQIAPDIIVTAAIGHILPAEILALPPRNVVFDSGNSSTL